MYYFPPMKQKRSVHFVAIAVMAHSISFHAFRASLLHHVDSKFNQDNEQLLKIMPTFDLVYYIFLVIGAFIVDQATNKYPLIILLMVLSLFGQISFYISDFEFLLKSTYVSVAAISATLKIGLIAWGAAQYSGIYCLNVCQYFAFIHIFETIGHLMALRFIKLEMFFHSVGSRLSCPYYAMMVSLLFEILASLAFSFCNTSNGVIDGGKSIITGIPKMCRILIVFTPFLIVWMNYGDGTSIWRWITQAKLMKRQILWYNISALEMLTVDLIAIIICAIGLYLVMAFSKCIVRKPNYVIGFGGCLMSIAMILSSYLYNTLKLYEIPKPISNTSILYIADNCHSAKFYNKDAYLKINSTSISLEEHQYIQRYVINLNGSGACYSITMSITYLTVKSKIYSCLYEKMSYVTQLACVPRSHDQYGPTPFDTNINIFRFSSNRHKDGHPKVCIVSTEATSYNQIHIKLEKMYSPDIRFTIMSYDNFTCRAIKEGRYEYRQHYIMLGKDIHFRYGSVYLFRVDKSNTTELAEIQKPLEITFWYLLAIIYLAAFGKNCIIITGMYVIYNQSPSCVRTIAIGSWLMIIKSGDMLYIIAHNQFAKNQQITNYMYTGILIGLMTVVFIIFYLCFDWDFTCDTTPLTKAPSSEEKDNSPESLLITQKSVPDQASSSRQSSKSNQSSSKRRKPYLTVQYHYRKY